MKYVTDTHALYWHLTKNPKLSKKAKKIFQEADSGVHQVMIPGIVLIEMVYLVEKGSNCPAIRHSSNNER